MEIKANKQWKTTLNKYYLNECYVNFQRTINVFFINEKRPKRSTAEQNNRWLQFGYLIDVLGIKNIAKMTAKKNKQIKLDTIEYFIHFMLFSY